MTKEVGKVIKNCRKEKEENKRESRETASRYTKKPFNFIVLQKKVKNIRWESEAKKKERAKKTWSSVL